MPIYQLTPFKLPPGQHPSLADGRAMSRFVLDKKDRSGSYGRPDQKLAAYRRVVVCFVQVMWVITAGQVSADLRLAYQVCHNIAAFLPLELSPNLAQHADQAV